MSVSTINDYLESFPAPVLDRLFQKPATCLTIFRLLPSLGKTFLMTLLFNEKAARSDDFQAWTTPKGHRFYTEAMEKLRRMNLIREQDEYLSLNKIFRTQMQLALTGGGEHNSFGVPCETPDKHRVDIDFLDQHATKQWETILHFMVGSELPGIPNDGILSLLRHSGLMEGSNANNMRITGAGFQFLLQDENAQMWTLLLQYLAMAEELQMDAVEILHFLFMLGSLTLGQDYALSSLTETQQKMLEDLRDYGIVYQRKSSSRRFYPTRLATTLTSDAHAFRSASAAMEESLNKAPTDLEHGFVVLETNFKIYAYTDSPLQMAVLNLFSTLKSRFANMVAGQITRESVRMALANGITADQIISYLNAHAHPQMRKKVPLLPPTVVDQIRLWQLELERMKATQGYLFKEFRAASDYELVVQYARELGVLVWENANKRMFFVSKEGNSQVVDFVRRRLVNR